MNIKQKIYTILKYLIAFYWCFYVQIHKFIKGWGYGYFQINQQKVYIIRKLSQGGFAKIYLVKNQKGMQMVLKKSSLQSKQSQQQYLKQINSLKKLSGCPHIIKYYGNSQVYIQNVKFGLILIEYAQGQTLAQYLMQKTVTIIELEIIDIIYMHKQGIFHHDLKLQNIIISNQVKIIDLGSSHSQIINPKQLSKKQLYKFQNDIQSSITFIYRSPEMIQMSKCYPIDDKADIWMIGCIIFFLAFCKHPFQQQSSLAIISGLVKFPQTPYRSRRLKNLIERILQPDPTKRPNSRQLLEILKGWNKNETASKNIKSQQDFEQFV